MKTLFAILFKLIVPVLILAAGGGAAWYLMYTAPEVERISAPPQAPVVQVVAPARGPFARRVEAFGSVRPAEQVTIAPEVSGRVLKMHEALEPGGLVNKGEVLLRIDEEEYALALAEAEGALAEAEAALAVERGRQRVAEREWELFGKDLPDAELGRELALREPQLRQAEARIASARSAVEQAKLQRKRTTIIAPFDAIVLEETVDLGQLLNAGQEVATLAGTDAFWVLASVPAERLSAVLEASKAQQETVQVYSDVDLSAGQGPRAGQLVRHLGQVDPDGRMAQVLVAIADPLHLHDDADSFPLPLNSYVRVEIDAGSIDGVAALPRRALRENSEVWVSDANDTLAVRPVDVVWRQGEEVAVRDTFDAADQLIVSALGDPLPGMALRPRENIDPAVAAEVQP